MKRAKYISNGTITYKIIGDQGPQGPKGDTGKSAYQIAVDNGYNGTESEWLATLKVDLSDLEGDYYVNKFDNARLVYGYIDGHGSFIRNDNFVLTGFIKVRPNDVIRIIHNGVLVSSSSITIATYDNRKQFLNTVSGNFTFTVPSNSSYKYIRFPINISGLDVSKITVTVNDSTLYVNPPTYHDNIPVFNVIENNKTSQEKKHKMFSSNHYISVDGITIETGYLKFDGTVATSTNKDFKVTDYIPIDSTSYKVTVSSGSSVYGVCYYDENKGFIYWGLRTSTVVDYVDELLDIPDGARYFRLSSYVTTPIANRAILIDDVYDMSLSYSNWTGKKCVQLGDSITWYDGKTQNIEGNDVTVKGYASYLREKGIIVDNYGVSGACITNLSTYTDVCETVTTVDFANYDLCIISAGVNDYAFCNSPIGDFVNESFDKGVFTQAYQFIIETILGQNKDIKIILSTPLQQTFKTDANGQGKLLIDYANQIKAIGEYYGLPVLDLYGEGGLNKINASTLTIDNIHPNNRGYKLVCEHSYVPFVISH